MFQDEARVGRIGDCRRCWCRRPVHPLVRKMLSLPYTFRLAQTPTVIRELDEWLRHRLRAVQLEQWRRGTTMFRELRKLGASVDLAARIAGHGRRWWHTGARGLNRILPIAYFDRLGVPRLS